MYDYIERRDSGGPPRPPTPPPIAVESVRWQRVGHWLASGAGDLLASRGRGLLFGLCYVAMGHQIARAHAHEWSSLSGLAAGFLFIGPLLAVGLYELSRQRERGERPELVVALFAWCRNPRGLCRHAALLAVLLTLWLHASWNLLEQSSPFWWLVWFAFSLVAFASSVVAVPLLLDRPIGVVAAVRASVACCLRNPVTMSVWAVAVATLIGASLGLRFWPLSITGPWIGHATWHVYRDCIGGSASEPRDRGET